MRLVSVVCVCELSALYKVESIWSDGVKVLIHQSSLSLNLGLCPVCRQSIAITVRPCMEWFGELKCDNRY